MPDDLPTPLDRIVPVLVDDLRATLGSELVGVYLYGSAIEGGFEPALSDLDLLIVVEPSIDAVEFELLAGIIERLCAREPAWAGRLDIIFVGRETLASFRAGGPFAEVSHDDALAVNRRAEDWIETWYLVRHADRAITGPSPKTLIPPIESDEFFDAISQDIDNFVAAVRSDGTRSGRVAYRLITLGRVLRSLETRELCTKREGFEWLIEHHPERADLAQAAWAVRSGEGVREFSRAEHSDVRRWLDELAGEVRARRR